MNYTELIGEYSDAYMDALKNGGQFYPGNGKDSANVIVRGKNCYTYWAKGSKRHKEVKELAQYFHIEPESQTGGRIARWLVSDVLRLPYEETFWQKQYRDIAKSGKHWHYSYVESYKPFYGVELDIKSAYISSLFASETLLYQNGIGYIDDNGALDFLKQLTPELPKWFRLQLLGVLAGWKFSFLTRDKSKPESTELLTRTIHKINYNAAFNCTHRAILRNYKIMKKIHEIGGQYIRRMHTDSYFLDIECPEEIELRIQDYVAEKGLTLAVKGCGKSFFFDLNTGFIGKKFIGCKRDAAELMREHEVKMKADNFVPEVMDRFGKLIENSSLYAKVTDQTERIYTDAVQMDIWNCA